MAEFKVMASAAFKEAYLALLPEFERASGHKAANIWVPSTQMMTRLKGGEVVDLVLLSTDALDELIQAGVIKERTDLARAGVAAAVKAGAPRPDISSGEALKRAVLAAKSVAYSQGPSGVYLQGLFQRWGIADEIKHKVRVVQGELAGAPVARGEIELAFQQMSELMAVPGIDIIGPLSADVQKITTFAAGLHARAPAMEAARELVRHLTAPAAAPVIRKKGMEPANG